MQTETPVNPEIVNSPIDQVYLAFGSKTRVDPYVQSGIFTPEAFRDGSQSIETQPVAAAVITSVYDLYKAKYDKHPDSDIKSKREVLVTLTNGTTTTVAELPKEFTDTLAPLCQIVLMRRREEAKRVDAKKSIIVSSAANLEDINFPEESYSKLCEMAFRALGVPSEDLFMKASSLETSGEVGLGLALAFVKGLKENGEIIAVGNHHEFRGKEVFNSPRVKTRMERNKWHYSIITPEGQGEDRRQMVMYRLKHLYQVGVNILGDLRPGELTQKMKLGFLFIACAMRVADSKEYERLQTRNKRKTKEGERVRRMKGMESRPVPSLTRRMANRSGGDFLPVGLAERSDAILKLYWKNEKRLSPYFLGISRMQASLCTILTDYKASTDTDEHKEKQTVPLASTVKFPVAVEFARYLSINKINITDPVIPINIKELVAERGVGIYDIYPSLRKSNKIDFQTFCSLALGRSSNVAFRDGRNYLIKELGGFAQLQAAIQKDIPSIELLRSSADFGMLKAEGGNTADFYEFTRYFAAFMADNIGTNNPYYKAILDSIHNSDHFDIGLYSMLKESGKLREGAEIYSIVGIIPPTWDNEKLAIKGYPPHMGGLTVGVVVTPDGHTHTVSFLQVMHVQTPRRKSRNGLLDEKEPHYLTVVSFIEKTMSRVFKAKFVETLDSQKVGF